MLVTLRLTDLATTWSTCYFGWRKNSSGPFHQLVSNFSMDFTLQYSDLDVDIPYIYNFSRVKWSTLVYMLFLVDFSWNTQKNHYFPWILQFFKYSWFSTICCGFSVSVGGLLPVNATNVPAAAHRVSKACSADAAGVGGVYTNVLHITCLLTNVHACIFV